MEHPVNPDFHGTDDQLEAYALGQLATSDQPGLEVLEEHLMICSTCRDRLDGVEAFISGMKDAFGPHSAMAISKQTELFAWLPWPTGFARVGLPRPGRHYFHIFAGADSIRPGGEPPARVRPAAKCLWPPRPANWISRSSTPPIEGQGFRAVIVNATGRTVWSGPARQGRSG